MKQGKRFFLFLTNALLLNLGAVGAVLSASSGFGMESGWLPVAMGSGTACLATALLSFGRKRGRWMLLLWGVWAVILLVGHTSFREGFCGFVYEVTSDYHVWFANVPVLFMRASREALQFFLGMMVSVTALLLAVTVLVWRSFAASLLVTLPAFCLPLVVTQVAADLPLLSVMLFWVLMLFSQVFRRVDPVRAAKTVWMLMLVVLVLLGGLLWVIPHEKKGAVFLGAGNSKDRQHMGNARCRGQVASAAGSHLESSGVRMDQFGAGGTTGLYGTNHAESDLYSRRDILFAGRGKGRLYRDTLGQTAVRCAAGGSVAVARDDADGIRFGDNSSNDHYLGKG